MAIRFANGFPMVLGLASWILYMIFLRLLANFLNQKVTGDAANKLLLHGLLLFVAAPIGFLLVGIGLLYLLGCLGFLILLVLFPVILIGYVILIARFLTRILEVIGTLRQVILSHEL